MGEITHIPSETVLWNLARAYLAVTSPQRELVYIFGKNFRAGATGPAWLRRAQNAACLQAADLADENMVRLHTQEALERTLDAAVCDDVAVSEWRLGQPVGERSNCRGSGSGSEVGK